VGYAVLHLKLSKTDFFCYILAMLLLLLCMELLWTINYEYFYDEFVVMPWKKGIQNGEKLWCSVTASKICTLYINGIVFTKIQFLWSSKGIFLIFLIYLSKLSHFFPPFFQFLFNFLIIIAPWSNVRCQP